MVKLATAREARSYGPYPARNRWEYINSGLYLLASILLIGGFAAQLSPIHLHEKSGLALVLIGLLLLLVVNVHDLFAHLAAVDYCLALVEFDAQLALVEFAVPVVQSVGTVLTFVAILFFEIQMERGYRYRLEKHGLNLMIAGPVLWLVGSIHNVCQIYESANGHVQILQKSVQIPLLMGSLLFLVAGIHNRIDIYGSAHSSIKILGKNWAWFCLSGSLLFFVGGFLNLVKVFKMQQMDGTQLEKLRGRAQERLEIEREGQVPLILEGSRSRRNEEESTAAAGAATPPVATPYKDVLLGSSQA
ncbi:uncharacterized protein [Typha latifolia]|uniref:uncharacterized protein n=1 Tax=Typha latifolia TaxID=4733 RepID=UPI003C2EA648